MESIQKLRWQDVINDVLVPSDYRFEWVKMVFKEGYESYNRDGLFVYGTNGCAEVSPLLGYFDRDLDCLLSAIDTLSKPWPLPLRSDVSLNSLVTRDEEIVDELLNYEAVKLKVHSKVDCERVKKVRDLYGDKLKIRLDLNGAFDVSEATEIIKDLSSVDIEFIEQPCRSNQDCASVRKKIDVPVALDESVRNLAQLAEVKNLDSADILVVKIQPCGGLHKSINLVDSWGKDVVVSNLMESKVGVDVGLALARSLDKLNYACGLVQSPLEKLIREPLDI